MLTHTRSTTISFHPALGTFSPVRDYRAASATRPESQDAQLMRFRVLAIQLAVCSAGRPTDKNTPWPEGYKESAEGGGSLGACLASSPRNRRAPGNSWTEMRGAW